MSLKEEMKGGVRRARFKLWQQLRCSYKHDPQRTLPMSSAKCNARWLREKGVAAMICLKIATGFVSDLRRCGIKVKALAVRRKQTSR